MKGNLWNIKRKERDMKEKCKGNKGHQKIIIKIKRKAKRNIT